MLLKRHLIAVWFCLVAAVALPAQQAEGAHGEAGAATHSEEEHHAPRTMDMSSSEVMAHQFEHSVPYPIALYELSCKAATALTRGSGVSHREIFLAYAYSLLPVALFYHLAHNVMHLLMEGGSVLPLLSDPRGRGEEGCREQDVLVRHAHRGPRLAAAACWSAA